MEDAAAMSFFERVLRLLRARRVADESAAAPAVAGEAGADHRVSTDESCLALYRNAIDCAERGDTAAAERMLQDVLALRHDFAEAHLALGRIYHGRGEFDDASDCYALATHFGGDRQAGHLRQGLLALDRGKFDEARGQLERALALDPQDAMAHNALGAALLKLGKTDAAAARFERAIELREDFAQAHSNLGYLLFREREQFESGARHIERALVLAPQDTGVLCNWTMVLQQQGRFDEHIALSGSVLSAHPDLHEMRLNRALVLLTRGDFRRGWRDYEARKHLAPYTQRPAQWPVWDGAALAGKTLFVRSEQGIGDEIMFASCLAEVVTAARACLVECSPRLESLFRRSFPAARVVPLGKAAALSAEEVDYEIAVGSLPLHFRNSEADFPRHAGFLVADASRTAFWKNRLAQLGEGLKVGISWRGGVQTTRRSLRSLPLELWLPILQCSGARFVSLQYGDVGGEITELRERHGVNLDHWQDAIDDLDETAALISALDLVITVQTAVAHLSGALGKKAWVMISAVPEWRYMERGASMPWYPALRLYRQAAPGEWDSLIEAVAGSLHGQITGSAGSNASARPQ